MSPDDSFSSLQLLLGRLRSGERGAVGALVAHCHDRFKLLTRQMRRRYPQVTDGTTDVFHDVVLELLDALGRCPVNDPAHLLRLTACIIRRRLLDLTRKRRPDHLPTCGTGESGGLRLDPPADTDDPHDLVVWHEFHSRLAELPADQRLLFDLMYYQGLNTVEAAQLLCWPLSTFQFRWRAARENIGRLLRGADPT